MPCTQIAMPDYRFHPSPAAGQPGTPRLASRALAATAASAAGALARTGAGRRPAVVHEITIIHRRRSLVRFVHNGVLVGAVAVS